MRGWGGFFNTFKSQSGAGKKITYKYAVGSHTGLVRELNEDSYLAIPEFGLWLVADGMGGHDAGEVASRIAVQEIALGIKKGLELTEAIKSAHLAIQDAGIKGQGAENMGTTVVAARLDGLEYEIAWVGDSRAYLWRRNLQQLTTDHSYVQMLFEAGLIAKNEIPLHPHRNVISQALGLAKNGSSEPRVESVRGEFNINDTLILCSDGLTGEVSDKVIAQIVAENSNNQTVVNCLIQAALAGGGKDNVTVIAISPEIIAL